MKPAAWLQPKSLLPDLALALWLALVAAAYLGAQLLDAWELAGRVLGR